MTDGTGARCEDVAKIYPSGSSEVRALEEVSARFPGRSLSIVSGPSGSGKSTLLRLLAGLDRPTRGRLVVDGVAVHRASARALLRFRRRKLGYLFQRPSDNFLPYLTVAEHLGMATPFPARSGVEPDQLVERLEIGARLGHLPSALSGGEQYRAALACLLASGPRVLLADEPTAALDTASAKQLTGVLRTVAESGMTVVVASHDPIVRQAADHVVELSHGRVVTSKDANPWSRTSRLMTGSSTQPRIQRDRRGSPSPGGTATLSVRGLRKSFRRGPVVVPAVRNATLSVWSREVVGLVGRSGSGKTTVLNIVAGWEGADAGEILRPGMAAAVPSWAEVAVVPQKLGLFDELTIRANVEYPARLAGVLDDLRDEIDGMIDALALGDVQHRHPRETSVGEQQRCAIARALVLTPQLLLADEPAGHQDGASAEAAFRAIRSSAERGTAALVATHAFDLLRFVDRVLSMADGHVPTAS